MKKYVWDRSQRVKMVRVITWVMFGAFVLLQLLVWTCTSGSERPIRDIPLSVRPEADPLRITVFGTSLSAETQIWPEEMARLVESCSGREVIIARVVGSGMGSEWANYQIPRVVISRPDVVLLEFATNDSDLLDGVSLEEARELHFSLLQGLKSSLPDASLVLMTMNPAFGLRGWVRPRLEAHYAQYVDIASETNVGLIDFFPRWQVLGRNSLGLDTDGLHPNPSVAAGLIAPEIAAFLVGEKEC